MNALGQSTRGLLLAVQYFTRLPLPPGVVRWTGFDRAAQRASLPHFPGVGLLVAGAAIASYWAAEVLLPRSAITPLLAAIVSTAATILLTGALHEDGLADMVDGLGGSTQRERALEIMKDSRIGAFGALSLMLAVLTKVAALGLIGSVAGWTGAAAALAGAHAVSRGLTLGIVATLPNIGRAATSKSLQVAAGIEWTGLSLAALWCALALAWSASLASTGFCMAGLAGAAAVWLWMRRLLSRRLGGFTGDCLGAAQQLCEIAFYLGAAVSLGRAVP